MKSDQRFAKTWLRCLFAVWSLGAATLAAADGLPPGEIAASIGVELGNQSQLPVTVLGTISRSNLMVASDNLSLDARAGRDATLVGVQYDRPTRWLAFGEAKARLEYRDEIISPASTNRQRYTALAAMLNLCNRTGSLLYCGGAGIVRTSVGEAPADAITPNYTEGIATSTLPLVTLRLKMSNFQGELYLPIGYSSSLDAEATPSNENGHYAKAVLRHTQFVGVDAWPVRFKLRLEGGIVGSGGNAPPLQQRFFGGGFDAVRGYAYRAVSQFDASGQLIGSHRKLVGSGEIMAKLFEVAELPIVTSLFYDVGRFYGPAGSVVAQARSYGAALTVPFKSGLVRLSVAQPLVRGFDTQRFQIEVVGTW